MEYDRHAPARRDPRGRVAHGARHDRGARLRRAAARAGRGRHAGDRAGRHDRPRRRARPRLPAARRRRPAGLQPDGARACRAPPQAPRAQGRAQHHAGRHRRRALDQRRFPRRHGRDRGHGCRRLRPLPHRARPDDARQLSGRGLAGHPLSPRARPGRRQARDVPHPRHRQRQAGALLAHADRGEPGAGLAGAAPDPRPAGGAAHPAAGAAARRRRARAQPHVPDGGRGGGIRRPRAICSTSSSSGRAGAAASCRHGCRWGP